MFIICSAAGQLFVFYTVRFSDAKEMDRKHTFFHPYYAPQLTTFDALVLATLTTTRKFFTILASCFVYGHSLKPLQVQFGCRFEHFVMHGVCATGLLEYRSWVASLMCLHACMCFQWLGVALAFGGLGGDILRKYWVRNQAGHLHQA